MSTQDAFDPAKYDPAKVPEGWTPPESDLPENPQMRKSDDPLNPVTRNGFAAARWIAVLFAFALLVRALHNSGFHI